MALSSDDVGALADLFQDAAATIRDYLRDNFDTSPHSIAIGPHSLERQLNEVPLLRRVVAKHGGTVPRIQDHRIDISVSV